MIVDLDLQFVLTILKCFIIIKTTNYLDVNKDIDILRQFLKKCKFNKLGWNTTAEIGINNSFDNNYSDVIFNRESSLSF